MRRLTALAEKMIEQPLPRLGLVTHARLIHVQNEVGAGGLIQERVDQREDRSQTSQGWTMATHFGCGMGITRAILGKLFPQ